MGQSRSSTSALAVTIAIGLLSSRVAAAVTCPDGGVDGGGPDLDPAAVAMTVRHHLGEIKSCYERQLRGNPSLAGKLVAVWTIDTRGATTRFHWKEDRIGDATLASCMQQQIDGLINFDPDGKMGGTFVLPEEMATVFQPNPVTAAFAR